MCIKAVSTLTAARAPSGSAAAAADLGARDAMPLQEGGGEGAIRCSHGHHHAPIPALDAERLEQVQAPLAAARLLRTRDTRRVEQAAALTRAGVPDPMTG